MSCLNAACLLARAKEEIGRGDFLAALVSADAAWMATSVAGDDGATADALRAHRIPIADFIVHVWAARAAAEVARLPADRSRHFRNVGVALVNAADYLARQADDGHVVNATGARVSRADVSMVAAEAFAPIRAALAPSESTAVA